MNSELRAEVQELRSQTREGFAMVKARLEKYVPTDMQASRMPSRRFEELRTTPEESQCQKRLTDADVNGYARREDINGLKQQESWETQDVRSRTQKIATRSGTQSKDQNAQLWSPAVQVQDYGRPADQESIHMRTTSNDGAMNRVQLTPRNGFPLDTYPPSLEQILTCKRSEKERTRGYKAKWKTTERSDHNMQRRGQPREWTSTVTTGNGLSCQQQ